MGRTVRVGLAQINTYVGGLDRNVALIIDYIGRARDEGVEIVCFPEMAITGYPPEDLLLKPSFINDNLKALEKVREASNGITVIVGFVDRDEDIFNAAAILHDGELVDVYHKMFLPNYGVFDENRYFLAGHLAPVYEIDGVRFGVNICEDIWYPGDPTRSQAVLGDAQIIFNISSSPYHASKVSARETMLSTRAMDNSCYVVFTNVVGGQDELVFDGHSVVVNERGGVIARAPAFEEHLLIADINTQRVFGARLHDPRRRKEKTEYREDMRRIEARELKSLNGQRPQKKRIQCKIHPFLNDTEEVWKALVLGTRDYIQKNGFEKALIGMSGGIDSSLVAALATEAVGSGNVTGIRMPSRYSSDNSIEDAQELCENLDMKLFTIPIEKAFTAYLDMLEDSFKGLEPNVTEENLQARIRGAILMAFSNKFGWLVLTTANKSETSVGYSTLYGDMAGGFAVIKDVPKSLVYTLSNYYNELKGREIIPQRVITKPPSAELLPDQKDSDSLPPYDVLDPILKAYVEDDLSKDEIVGLGFDESLVAGVIKLVDGSEYKRRQGPPGIKITSRAFGKDRRIPITNLYHV